MQALIPRQAAELVHPPLVCKGSPVFGLPAGDSSSGLWGDLSLNPGGVQAVQALIPRQAVLGLNPGRSVGSTGAHSQAGSANPQPRQAVLVPPVRKECRHSFSGRQC